MRIGVLICLSCALLTIQSEPLCVKSCKAGEQEQYGDHCYYWSPPGTRGFDPVMKTWDESKFQCKSMNGTLAAVTSQEIHNFLMKKVERESRYKYTWFWIGGTDEDAEGNWEWIDGSEWNFPHWSSQAQNKAKQQPDGGVGQNCLQIYHGIHARNGWNDQYCYTTLPYICSWRICEAGLELLACHKELFFFSTQC